MISISDILSREGAKFNLTFTNDMLDKFETYAKLLMETNKNMNLTAITEEREIAVKHFLDSLVFLSEYDLVQGSKLIDVGTGAGFPGLVLQVFRPDLDVTLVDSLNKRVEFLKKASEMFHVKPNCIHARAEELSRNDKYREKFDIAISRAVARLNVLAEYDMPFVKVGGMFIAMKGPAAYEEIKESENAIQQLGGEVQQVKEFTLPDDSKRVVVFVKKVSETPAEYPRRSAKISKQPL